MILALGMVAGVVLLFQYGLPFFRAPRLSDSQKQWKEYSRDAPPGHPLEVVAHGYRMIRAYRKEVAPGSGAPPRDLNLVEWEWKILVRNRTLQDREVFANYYLVDENRLMVDADALILQKPVPSGETVTILHQTDMVYEDSFRVASGVWEIFWEEGKTLRKVRREGF